MAAKALRTPLRTLTTPRPAIVAWRSARCFATEPASSPSGTPSAPIITPVTPGSTSSAGSSTPVLGDAGALASAPGSAADGGAAAQAALRVGVVVSSGKMQRTVKVRLPGQKWNKYLRKHFKDHKDHLVHDPNSSLNTGDVVSLRPHRAAKHVHHVVDEILVPFGPPISSRPPVPSEAESHTAYEAKRGEKLERRGLRRAAALGVESAIEKLQAMGVDAGQGADGSAGDKNSQPAKKGAPLGGRTRRAKN